LPISEKRSAASFREFDELLSSSSMRLRQPDVQGRALAIAVANGRIYDEMDWANRARGRPAAMGLCRGLVWRKPMALLHYKEI